MHRDRASSLKRCEVGEPYPPAGKRVLEAWIHRCGFESRRGYKAGSLTAKIRTHSSVVERLVHTEDVGGSSPSESTGAAGRPVGVRLPSPLRLRAGNRMPSNTPWGVRYHGCRRYGFKSRCPLGSTLAELGATTAYGGHSSVGRAPRCGRGCRGFESPCSPERGCNTVLLQVESARCTLGRW